MLTSIKKLVFLFLLLCALSPKLRAQDAKKIILQGFWWDFKNNNYPQGWANYLIDLSPRLRKIGLEVSLS